MWQIVAITCALHASVCNEAHNSGLEPMQGAIYKDHAVCAGKALEAQVAFPPPATIQGLYACVKIADPI
jgi:hypothetical protein